MSELGEELIEGMKNALAFAEDRPVAGTRTTVIDVPALDVRAIRNRMDLSQKAFAAMFGFSLSSVRNWEQGTRRPEKTAQILLALAGRHPETVRETVATLKATRHLPASPE